jgi:hypothetical protein
MAPLKNTLAFLVIIGINLTNAVRMKFLYQLSSQGIQFATHAEKRLAWWPSERGYVKKILSGG